MKRKALSDIEIPDSDQGVIQAVFATLNVKDHDGDVTLPGAFEQGQKVLISQYNHGTWKMGALPAGIGTIKEDGLKAILTGQFFLKTHAGRETFESIKAVKEAGGDTEYSYGYDVLDQAPGSHEGAKANFLKKLKVIEVSPVLRGAGLGTETVSIKSFSTMTDDEIAEEAEAAFKALQDRGLPIPEVLSKAVRCVDAARAELKRQQDTVRGIALFHGFHPEKGDDA